MTKLQLRLAGSKKDMTTLNRLTLRVLPPGLSPANMVMDCDECETLTCDHTTSCCHNDICIPGQWLKTMTPVELVHALIDKYQNLADQMDLDKK